MRKAILAIVTLAYLFLCGSGLAADINNGAPAEGESASAAMKGELQVTLQIPLMSPLFADTPVAVVNDEPITVRDLTRRISDAHEGKVDTETSAKKNYTKLLERVISSRLIVQEARNIGLDETDSIKAQIESFSTQQLITRLMAKALANVEPNPKEVDDLYEMLSREFLLTALNFQAEADILSFQAQIESGSDFHELAARVIEQGTAEGELDGRKYLKLKDLLPRIAQVAFNMEVGTMSQIFRAPKGYLIFYVDGIRSYEDPALRVEARQKILDPLKKEKAREYGDFLEKKYVTIDEKLLKEMNFEGKRGGFLGLGKKKPLDFETLLNDDRVLATVHGDDSSTVTVADVAGAMGKKFFHGVEKALERTEDLKRKKTVILTNILFKKVAVLEAKEQGLDETEEYLDAVEENTNALLFGEFVSKVAAPDIKIKEEEAQQYHKEHIDDFSTPAMFRMNGLAFSALSDAEKAVGKLRRGADFAWVSANSPGQVDRDTQGVLRFEKVLLSATALPEGLEDLTKGARSGDAILYSGPQNQFHYVISIGKVFPAKPKAYETAQEEIGQILFNEKLKALIDDWTEKLREGYETRIFIRGLDG